MSRNLIIICCLLLGQTAAANWFENNQQQAHKFYQQGDYQQAAKTFKDPYRKGVALYRDGDYEQAADAFGQVQRKAVKIAAMYNLGNSQFHLDNLDAAAEAYRQVLQQDAEHADASHNLSLTLLMLAEAEFSLQEAETRLVLPFSQVAVAV